MAIGNSGSRIVGNTEFYGGLSTDRKIGIENSYYDGECLDVRKSPSQMTVLPMSRKVQGSSNITGLVVAMDQSKNGVIWGIDENGRLYHINSDNDISIAAETNGGSGFGLKYFSINDSLVFTDSKHSIFNYGPIVNPRRAEQEVHQFDKVQDDSEYIVSSIQIQKDGSAIYYQSNPDQPRADADKNRAFGTTISETEEDKILLLPGITPLAQVGIGFHTLPASGEITVTVHNENDEIMGTATLAVSDCTTTGFTWFSVLPNPSLSMSPANQLEFTPWSGETIETGTEMHVHVTSTVSGGKIYTYDEDSLYTTAKISAKGFALAETYNGKHPVAVMSDVYIGNGRYVAVLKNSPLGDISDTWYTANGLRLDDGFEVCAFGTSDEYLIVGAEKYNQRSAHGFQEGRIYFWDTLSEGPNFYIDSPMGSPKCIYNFGNIVYFVISGALYAYTGGKELVKVRTLKGTDTELTGRNSVTEVYPNMMTIRREILLLAFPSHTDSYNIRFGVHAWGSIDKNYPNCFTYNYKIPAVDSDGKNAPQHNSESQRLRLGCVYNFNDSLFYGYEYTTIDSEGVETTDVALAVVDNESGLANEFKWESLQYDAGSPALEKQALRVGIYFDPLPNGVEITPMYRIDNGEWIMGPKTAGYGERYVTCEINKRIHELQYGFIGTTTNSNITPVIKQVSAEVRILNEEAKL